MCWIVRTRFCIGIWLYNPQNQGNQYFQHAKVEQIKDYQEALQKVKEEAGRSIEIRKLSPNRLYQIRMRAIYMVFYNKQQAGFTEMEKSADFLKSNHVSPCFFKKKYRLDYREAIAMVTALGAITGSDEICLSKVPMCGRLITFRNLNE